MPIHNCPFMPYTETVARPTLPAKIINPHTGDEYWTYGLIDTGADDCAVPASVAKILGHDLQAGQQKLIRTGNGETTAYSHITRFEIYHPVTKELVYTIDETPIDFMPNLNVVLFGVTAYPLYSGRHYL